MMLRKSRFWSLLIAYLFFFSILGVNPTPVEATVHGLAPIPKFKAFEPGTGNPLASGKLYTYLPGTTTLTSTYTDYTGGTLNANPIILDANGECNLFYTGWLKLALYDANNVLVWTKDNIPYNVLLNNISADNVLVNLGNDTLTVNQALTSWTDIRAYGVTCDGTTDDTNALNTANTAAKGLVVFPDNCIVAISSTFNLKTATEYRGPRGGTVSSGDSGPQTGRGAALKWIGADNSVIVNMEGTYNSVWDGIDIFGPAADDTEAELTSRDLIGLRLHSDNDPASQRNRISNTRIWNVNYGIVVGGLADTTYTYQTDGWTIENFWIWLVNTGIYINGGNASQYSTIRSGNIGQFVSGINVYEGSYFDISNVAFSSLQSPTGTRANITLYLPQLIKIERTQGEPQAGTVWDHIRITGGATLIPITLSNNWFDGSVIIANASPSQRVISIGNQYNDNVLLSGTDAIFTSIGDLFSNSGFGGVGIVDEGTNNYIAEVDNYYDNTTPAFIKYRSKFNNVVKEYRLWNTVDLRSNGLQTFTDNDATPSVLNGDFFQTANTGATTITNFDDGVEGQKIFVFANDANTTIDFSASSIKGNAGVDNTLAVGDWVECRKVGTSWYCLLGKSQ